MAVTGAHELRLLAPSPHDAQLVKLVAAYAGLLDDLTVVDGQKELQLLMADGGTLRGSNTICRHITKHGPTGKALLGANADEDALVAQWLSARYSMLSPVNEEGLQQLDDALLTRTFLLGTSLSLADLVLFGVLHPAVKSFPSAQLGRLRNIVRWYDYLQHTVDPHGVFPRVTLKQPPLRLSPPVFTAPGSKAKESAATSADSKASATTKAAAPPAAAKAGAAPAAKGKPAAAVAALAAPKSGAAAPAAEPAAKAGKKEKKEKAEKPAAATKEAAGEPGVDALDIRVGQIVKVERHPNADALYVEEIDLGEEKPRQIVSGLVNCVPIEKMLHRRVVVLTNLKPAKMRDVLSSGMVLCASNATHDQVDPISPPEGAAIGERITFEGFPGEPEAQLNPKKKVFEKLAPDLTTTAEGIAVFKGVPFMTSKGPVTASIPNAHVK